MVFSLTALVVILLVLVLVLLKHLGEQVRYAPSIARKEAILRALTTHEQAHGAYTLYAANYVNCRSKAGEESDICADEAQWVGKAAREREVTRLNLLHLFS